MNKRRSIGSSILPYAIDNQHNNIFFLLGSERTIPNWIDSGKFSDFGGSTKYKGESPETTAAREYHEETCCCVPFNESEVDMDIRTSWKYIVEELKNEKYSFCLRTNIDDNKCYYTYVKQIPFHAGIPRKSSNIISSLLRIRNIVRATGKYKFGPSDTIQSHPAIKKNTEGHCIGVSRDYLEKQQLIWISITHAQMLLKGQVPENSTRGRRQFIFRDSFKARFQSIVSEFYNSVARLKDPLKISIHYNKKNNEHGRHPVANVSKRKFGKRRLDKQNVFDFGKHLNKPKAGGQEQSEDTLEVGYTTVRGPKHRAHQPGVQVEGSDVSNIGSLSIV